MKRHTFEPLDRTRLRTRSRVGESRRLQVGDLASVPGRERPLREFLDGLPHMHAADELRAILASLERARAEEKVVLAMVGAHVVKTGCSPLLLALARSGYLHALALSGATAIHDYELACFGSTSEDVGQGLVDGSFGMWEETGGWMNAAARSGHARGVGLGQALGEDLVAREAPYRNQSLLAAARVMGIPATVHVAMGTDIVHQHPGADGAALGATTLHDFDLLAGVLSRIGGGVVLNLGSAVILPEVFLKAITMARNTGADPSGLTLVNLDQQAHYRTRVNFLERPARAFGGKALQILGPHELLLPLLVGGLEGLDK